MAISHTEQSRIYREKNRESYNAYMRDYHRKRKEDPTYVRNRRRSYAKFYYGLTAEEYDALEAEHAGKCAICGKEASLVIDHNHDTNVVRALLCSPCNSAIGFAQEDSDILRAMASYLDTHNESGR